MLIPKLHKRRVAILRPLQIACEKNASITVIAMLIDAYPAGIQESDESSSFPLHVACKNSTSSIDVIAYIINAYPRPHGIRAACSKTSHFTMPVVIFML